MRKPHAFSDWANLRVSMLCMACASCIFCRFFVIDSSSASSIVAVGSKFALSIPIPLGAALALSRAMVALLRVLPNQIRMLSGAGLKFTPGLGRVGFTFRADDFDIILVFHFPKNEYG